MPGVPVVEASGVSDAGDGVLVGRDRPGRVAGRVEVTKTEAGVFTDSGEIFTQAASPRPMSRMRSQIFFIFGILHGKDESRRNGIAPALTSTKTQGFAKTRA